MSLEWNGKSVKQRISGSARSGITSAAHVVEAAAVNLSLIHI